MKILNNESQLSYLGLTASLLLVFAIPSKAQITNFVDNFTGPTLNPAWTTVQGTPGDLIGFDGTNGYVVQNQAAPKDSGLERTNLSTGGVTNSWTADLTVATTNFVGSGSDLKFRFWAPQFIEIDLESDTGSPLLRVYSAEKGENIVVLNNFPIVDGEPLNLRLSYDGSSGKVLVGYSLGQGTPLQLIASANGLKQFNIYENDIVLTKFDGSAANTAVMEIQHYQMQPGALPISFPPFTDYFPGPTLDPSWTIIGPSTNQIGFANPGYVVQNPQIGVSSGLSHGVNSTVSFTTQLAVVLTNFVGAGTDFQFDFPSQAGAGDIDFSVTPSGDLYVYSQELSQNIGSFPGFGLKDGDVLNIILTYDAINAILDVGVNQNGGATIRLAEVVGLHEFSPTSDEILLSRTAIGNSKNPEMKLEFYQTSEGFQQIAASPFSDNFSGPTLDPSWVQLGTPADQIGFNGVGQYVVQSASSTTNGLSRRIGFNGDFTANLSVRLTNFLGSGSAFRFILPSGTNSIEMDYSSSDDLSIYDSGMLLGDYGPLNFTNGDTLNLRIAYSSSANQYEFGASLNNNSLVQVASDGGSALIPTVNGMVISQQGAGNGQHALMELDSYSISANYSEIPMSVPPFTEEFTGPNLDGSWVTGDVQGGPSALLGFNGLGQYEIKNYTNQDVYLLRSIGNGVGPFGSFTVDLTAEFPEFLAATTDFKLQFFYYPGIYVVLNQFGLRADVDAPTGGNAIGSQSIPGMTNGDKVSIRFAYKSETGVATLGYTRNNGPRVIIGQSTGLFNFTPTATQIDTYKWGTGTNTLDALLDHFEISPGALPMAGPLSIRSMVNGNETLTWIGGGILQSAPSLTGPWTDVSAATSPYIVPSVGGSMYFRTRE